MSDILFDKLTEIEFVGKNFVFTGLNEKQKSEATKIVLRMQGVIRSSVVLQTDYLVVDVENGTNTTKYSRAQELLQRGYGLKIITWDDFLALANDAMQHTSLLDFIISDGVLEHYYGRQSHVVIPEGVVSISEAVFAGKTDFFTGNAEEHYMESVELPQSLERIGADAFFNCNRLQKITIPPNVKTIGKFAFYGCKNLKDITILGEKTIVKPERFEALIFDALLPVLLPGQIPASLKQKALELFVSKCDSGEVMQEKYRAAWIKYIKSQRKNLLEQAVQNDSLLRLFINEKMLDKDSGDFFVEKSTQAGNTVATAAVLEYLSQQHAFDVPSVKAERTLKTETADAVLKKLWSTQKKDDGTLLLMKYKGNEETVTIPSRIGLKTVSELDCELFSHCRKGCGSERGEYFKTRLQKVIVSEGITSISVACFAHCNALTEISLPESLRVIHRRAFDFCVSLASARIPAGVESIEAGAFGWCNSLSDVYVLGKNTQIERFAFSNTPHVTIHAPKGSLAIKFAKKYKFQFVEE